MGCMPLMTRTGPYLTLVVGFALGAVLTALSVNASQKDDSRVTNPAPAGTAAAGIGGREAPSPAASAPASRPPVARVGSATYAGRVAGGLATIAISIRDGRAVAYLCDGKRTEAWLQGTAANGTLSMRGAKGAELTGTYAGGTAKGTLAAGGREWTFSVGTVAPPSGLYRATASVRNATVVAGWICLPGAGCVGTYTVDGENPSPGPALNQDTGTAVVGGTTVQAELQ